MVLADIDTAALTGTLDELRKISNEVIHVEADVSRQSHVENSVRAAVERFGRLDIMINNAGIAINKAFLSVTEADFDRVLSINLKGAFFGFKRPRDR